MTTAFVLGNGQSRKTLDLDRLRPHGHVYGCNAIYRDWTPDTLVTVDKNISEQIQHAGYGQRHRLFTRKPLPGLGALRIPEHYWGYSSGPAALALACIDRHAPIYLLGFDMGSVGDRFNNVYADTEFYKKSSARPTYAGNWVRQVIEVARNFPACQIVRVTGSESAQVQDFDRKSNIDHMDIAHFREIFHL